MSVAWESLSWPEAGVAPALAALARALRLAAPRATSSGVAPDPGLDAASLDLWLADAALHVGLRLQPTDCGYVDLHQALARLGPCLLRLELGTERRYLAIRASNGRRCRLVTPGGRERCIPRSALHAQLGARLHAEAAVPIAGWLSALDVAPGRARRARRRLRELLLEERRVSGLYVLRPDEGSPFLAQLAAGGLLRRAAQIIVLSAAQVALTLAGWVLLGRGVLDGQLELGWVGAWVWVQLSVFLLQLAVIWHGGSVVHAASALLKQRLLCGALRVDSEQLQRSGAGRLLAMVFESTALENAGLSGGLGLVLGGVQLVGAAIAIGLGASGPSQLLFLLGWCLLMVALARSYYRARATWTSERFDLGRAFVENVVGNRTRVVQQPERRWHELEDRALSSHLATSADMDAGQVRMTALPARGWLWLGCAGLMPALLEGHATWAELAISIGGVLQAYAAFGALTAGLVTLGGAHVAWQQVAPLFHAASRQPELGNPAVALAPRRPRSPGPEHDEAAPILDVRALGFSHPGRPEAILHGCELCLFAGDRVLIGGSSGAGKSTLAALLVGLRQPGAGHVLLSGLDRATLGALAWRRRIASAPQFHENHILSGSLAFNLLMGRGWPASAADLGEARAVAGALGLDGLIRRMPSGLEQVIGETGWQLSHGERSRLFLARALLQRADVIVLDESFGALDPHTLLGCMRTVLERSPTLVVIAHP